MRQLRIVAGLICLSLVLAGCGAAARTVAGRQEAGSVAPALPAPSTFARHASIGAAAPPLGAQFEPGAHNVAPDGTVGLFSPAFDGTDLAGAAWAVYAFPPGTLLQAEDRLQVMWQSIPDASVLWIGLGDQSADRWDWLNSANPSLVQYPSTAKYAAPDGSALVAVLLLGSAQARLSALRFGSNTAPVAALSATPDSGLAPFDVTLIAAGSADPNDTIMDYSWDLDGNGTYETDSGVVSVYTFTLDELPQQALVGVQVTDAANNTATATASVDITGTQFVEPPAETYTNTGSWLVDAYKPLPEWRDSNRCFQNAWFTDQANQMLSLLNADRAANSVAPLSLSKQLELVAQAHSRNMVLNAFLNSTDQYGWLPWDRTTLVAAPYSATGELVSSVPSAQDTVDALKSDAIKHGIMLDANYTHAAIGFYGDTSGNYGWTLMYMTAAADPDAADWIDPDEVP